MTNHFHTFIFKSKFNRGKNVDGREGGRNSTFYELDVNTKKSLSSPSPSSDLIIITIIKQPCCEMPGVILVILLSCGLNYTLIDVNISVILTNRNVTASSSPVC